MATPPQYTEPGCRAWGALGELERPLALGVLRLSVEGRPDESDALAVVHFALGHGVRVIDTADVYSQGDEPPHYGERLVRDALRSWRGPADEVRVLTKVGLTRRAGRWAPNGDPAHVRRSVDESLQALGVERLFLLQWHVRDPRVPLAETLDALAELQRAGKVEHLGLCNVSLADARQAAQRFTIAALQIELGLARATGELRGLLDAARDWQAPVLAYRLLGGVDGRGRLAACPVLAGLAERHQATAAEVALAATRQLAPQIIPLVGATRAASLRSSLRSLEVTLDASDRTALSLRYPGWGELAGVGAMPDVAMSSAARTSGTLAPNCGPGEQSEVVLLMGIQGAGKSELVADYVAHGYRRLNRDEAGGRLDDLAPRLETQLAEGQRRVVLDNTYPSRASRAAVIAVARRQGVPVRCRHLRTPPHEARINIVLRMLARYGMPLGPDEMRALRKADPNLPPPQALNMWLGSYEPPSVDEGFDVVDEIPFVRREPSSHTTKGLLLDVDGTLRRTLSGEVYPRSADDLLLLPERRERLLPWVEAGYRLFFVSNQSGIASGRLTHAVAQAAFLRTAQLLGLPVTEIAYCPHPSQPVGCFCRKPYPGLGVYLIERHGLSREHLTMVGDLPSDEEFATGLGARFYPSEQFFSAGGPRP